MSEKSDHSWLAKAYNIPLEHIRGYNSGICYSKIWVTNKESADKVSEKEKGNQVNGGWFDGMRLGGQSEYTDQETGETYWEVMC